MSKHFGGPLFSAMAAFSVLLAAAAPAVAHVLNVPFFKDDGGDMVSGVPELGGAAGFVTVRNTRNEPITMYLVYSQMDPAGDPVMQQAVPFTLVALEAVTFRPVADDAAENFGRGVPNMLPGLGTEGSVQIIWIGGPELASALVGRYHQLTAGSDMAHVLLE